MQNRKHSVDLILSLSKDEVVAPKPPLARPQVKPGQTLVVRQAYHEVFQELSIKGKSDAL